jgi:transcriptional regulator with XRE-family HTH domain
VIGKRIRASRKAANMTQQELARRLGLHTQTISYYERGEWIPPADRVEQIAKVLGDPSLTRASEGAEAVRVDRETPENDGPKVAAG